MYFTTYGAPDCFVENPPPRGDVRRRRDPPSAHLDATAAPQRTVTSPADPFAPTVDAREPAVIP